VLPLIFTELVSTIATMSSIDQSRSAIPAVSAGVTRSVL
jgi:hypothetical protein